MMMRKSVAFSSVLMHLVFACVTLSSTCNAHPFHISMAEFEFNAKTGRFEIGLKLNAADLERAISRRVGRKVDLDREELKKPLESFLNECFVLTRPRDAKSFELGEGLAAKSRVSKVRFLGKENEISWMWLYFELELSKAGQTEQDLVLVNSLFLDTVDGQINTVVVRMGTSKKALRMDQKQPWQPLPKAWRGDARQFNPPPATSN